MMRWNQHSNLKEIVMLSSNMIQYLIDHPQATAEDLKTYVTQQASSEATAMAAIMWVNSELKRQKQNPGARHQRRGG